MPAASPGATAHGGTLIRYRLSQAATVIFRVEKLGKPGANKLRFSGRIGGRRLAAGRYRLVAQAQARGVAATTLRAGFAIR